MAIDFPANPSTNDTFTVGSITYKWDGAKWIGLGVTPTDRLIEGNNKLEIDANNDLVWTGNKVGIGTDDISGLLEVYSSSSTINALTLRTGAGANGYAGISFASNLLQGREKAAIYFQETSAGAHHKGDIVFALDDNSGDAVQVSTAEERLRITSTGKLEAYKGTSTTGKTSGSEAFTVGNGAGNHRFAVYPDGTTVIGGTGDIANNNIILQNDGAATFGADATINGITVGRGGGNIASNIAFGLGASNATSTGSNNIAIGQNALYSHTSGLDNIALGYHALYDVEDGHSNVAIGRRTGQDITGSYNVGLGVGSLYSGVGINKNTVAGYEAGYNLAGDKNVAIGHQSGYYVTGSNNTILGAWKGSNLGSDTVLISAGETERLRIDSSGRASIGLGQDCNNFGNNFNALQIHSSSGQNTYLSLTNSTTGTNGTSVGLNLIQYGNESIINNRSIGYMAFFTRDLERLRITSDGDVEVGPSGAPATTITTAGAATFAGVVISGTTPNWASATSTGIELNPAAATNYIGIKNSSTSTVTNTAFQINHGLNVTTSILNSGAATFADDLFAIASTADTRIGTDSITISGTATRSKVHIDPGGWIGGGNVYPPCVAVYAPINAADAKNVWVCYDDASTGTSSYITADGSASFASGNFDLASYGALSIKRTDGNNYPLIRWGTDTTYAGGGIYPNGAATFTGKIEAGGGSTSYGVEANSGSNTSTYASVSARNFVTGGNVWQGKNAASGTQTSKITESGAATFAGPLNVGNELNAGSGVNIYGGGSIYIRQTSTGSADKLLIIQNNNSTEVANLNGAGGATFKGNILVGDTTTTATYVKVTRSDTGNVWSGNNATDNTSSIDKDGAAEFSKMGIGTYPHAGSTLTINSGTNANAVSIRNTLGDSSGAVGILFSTQNHSGGREKAAIFHQETHGTAHYGGDLLFCLNSSTGSATQVSVSDERMRITKSGDVGIGLVNPAYKLDVNGSGYFAGDLTLGLNATILANSSSGSVRYQGGNTYPGGNILCNGGSGGDNIIFGTSGASATSQDRMIIRSSNGYTQVGIGTSTPACAMTIKGGTYKGNSGNGACELFDLGSVGRMWSAKGFHEGWGPNADYYWEICGTTGSAPYELNIRYLGGYGGGVGISSFTDNNDGTVSIQTSATYNANCYLMELLQM